MTRRCSHCSNNGHNSRTCPTIKGVKLFGVRLTDGGSIIKKSASVGNLSHYYSSNGAGGSSSASPNPGSPISPNNHRVHVNEGGYVSDDPAHASCSSNCRGGGDRKKGTPWTEEEHRLFLLGLQKLGKGDWRGIARNFVISRTPTQVASHAQKYFIRQTNSSRRKRRSSLFDMVPDMSLDRQVAPEEPQGMSQVEEDEQENHFPSLGLSLDGDYEPMDSTYYNTTEAEETAQHVESKPITPSVVPTYVPLTFPLWPPKIVSVEEDKRADISVSPHQVLKPRAILSRRPVNLDELVGMSTLTLGATAIDRIEPSPLSLKLIGSSRQSAFHANRPVDRSGLSKSDGNAIPAA
ncbi:hypothetical protein ACHQM5_002034 [Ranunculus cassubicifolius]